MSKTQECPYPIYPEDVECPYPEDVEESDGPVIEALPDPVPKAAPDPVPKAAPDPVLEVSIVASSESTNEKAGLLQREVLLSRSTAIKRRPSRRGTS